MIVNLLMSLVLGGPAYFLSLIEGHPIAPGIPSASTAHDELAQLVVAPQGPQQGYSRAKFPHWITQHGACNTREFVLKRDGRNVVQSSSCAAVSGTWFSPYEGRTQTHASDIDIDHVVPLSNAWKSGAAEWTTEEREAFANDLTHPQLLAVTDVINQQKGDKGPEEWQPSREDFHCTYAEMWGRVKLVYNLTITSDEESALSEMLNTC